MSRFPPKKSGKNRVGLTLIEFLVALAILSALAVLLGGVTHSSLNNAKAVKNINNLRQISGALLAYATDRSGRLPWSNNPGSEASDETTWTRELAKNGYVKDGRLFFGPWSGKWYETPVARWKALQTPSSSSRIPWAYPSYGANRYGAMPHQTSDGKRKSITLARVGDGGSLSKLLLLRDVYDSEEAARGGGAIYFTKNQLLPKSKDRSGYSLIHAAFADGHVNAFTYLEMAAFGSKPKEAPYFEDVYTLD